MQGCKFEYAVRQLTSERPDSRPVIPCNVRAYSVYAHQFLCSSACANLLAETQPSGTRDPHIFVDFTKPLFAMREWEGERPLMSHRV